MKHIYHTYVQRRVSLPPRTKMTTSTIVSFALVVVILVIHVMHACPLSTGLCRQYGHSCLGGHGKRSDSQNSRLLKYLIREIYDQPKLEPQVEAKDLPDNKNWENPFDKKPNKWDGDSDDSLSASFFN